MEGEVMLAATASLSSPPLTDAALAAVSSPDANLLPLGSPEDGSMPEPRVPYGEDDCDHEQDLEHGQDANHETGADVFTEGDLKLQIIKQVEYYFSDENLPTDKYMLNLMKKNKDGFVPVGVIASFRKMKRLSRDHALISAALKESTFLVVSPDGKKVKRLNPLPAVEVRDPKLFTVLVENLPEDHSVENLQKRFDDVGNVKKISIHDSNASEEMKKGSKTLYSSKLHALVEYESTESAEKAATTLNNEEDWRNGMRVKLLQRVGKYVQRRQARTESDKTTVCTSIHAGEGETKINEHHHHEHHEDTPNEEDGDRGAKEKNGERGRNHGSHGRGRRHKYRGANGHGHGTVAAPQVIEASKPPPGPKMPDGTRGFSMGRGKHLSCDRC